MTSVHVESLTKQFAQTRALDGVSVDVARGELFFLLGPSGCGKTTLLRSIAGFYTPDSGRIRFGEREVTHLPPQRRDTGMVFQNYALWPHMSVESNVGFGLSVRRVPRVERRRRVAEALELVQMSPYARRSPNQLSGGQQQRVALARALVIRPQCLLLDEPLSNLDAKLRIEMRGEIRRLTKEFGLTGIYVTHDQKEALTIADRMAVMFSGRIAQVGTPRELYCRPRDARIADFLGETNFISARRTVGGTTAEYACALGTLRGGAGASDASGGDGSAVTLSIRPEAIVVRAASAAPAAPPNGSNRFSGTVAGVTYLGEALQLMIHVGQTPLRASLVERAGAPRLQNGTAVEIEIDASDVVALAASDALE